MPHAAFESPLGKCAIGWRGGTVTGFWLPDSRRAPFPDETRPPPWVEAIIERVKRHLGGVLQDFSDVPYDFELVPEFGRSVLQATLRIKSGHTATYGEIAAAIGEPASASRAVGSALGGNPWPLLIPCHRVVSAGGGMTGFSGPGGVTTKARLLALEGARLL